MPTNIPSNTIETLPTATVDSSTNDQTTPIKSNLSAIIPSLNQLPTIVEEGAEDISEVNDNTVTIESNVLPFAIESSTDAASPTVPDDK